MTARNFIQAARSLLRRVARFSRPGGRGFSLLEVLLAAGIAAMVFLAVSQSFSFGVNVSRRVEQGLDLEAQRVFAYVSRDLRSAYPGKDATRGSQFVGTEQGLRFMATTPLNTRAGADDLNVIAYQLQPLSAGLFSLEQKRSRFWPIKGEKEVPPILLSSHIRSLQFRFFDGQQWERSWGGERPLPLAVHITVEFSSAAGGKVQPYSTIVRLPCH